MAYRVSPQLVGDYFRLFVNPRAYTVQSARPHPESGRHYYYRPTGRKTGGGLSLTTETLRRHVEGEITIALYAINPATQGRRHRESSAVKWAPSDGLGKRGKPISAWRPCV
jgi:hypothetical protein